MHFALLSGTLDTVSTVSFNHVSWNKGAPLSNVPVLSVESKFTGALELIDSEC